MHKYLLLLLSFLPVVSFAQAVDIAPANSALHDSVLLGPVELNY